MTEKLNGRSWKSTFDRRSYLKAASGVLGVATLAVNASAEEGTDGPDEPPEVEPFFETFDGDLAAYEGAVSAFEVVTGDGGN